MKKIEENDGHAEDEITPSARRAPVQNRSHETVHRIFDATARLLEQVPAAEITTSRIAQESGVSIGGLYRFFPDKQAIIDGIALKHVREFEAMVRNRLVLLVPLGASGFLDAVIDRYVEFLDARPDFRTIVFGNLISPATRQQQIQSDIGTAGLVKQVIMHFLGVRDEAEFGLKLRIASEAGDRLIAYAYEQPSRGERDQVIGEVKTLLRKYLLK